MWNLYKIIHIFFIQNTILSTFTLGNKAEEIIRRILANGIHQHHWRCHFHQSEASFSFAFFIFLLHLCFKLSIEVLVFQNRGSCRTVICRQFDSTPYASFSVEEKSMLYHSAIKFDFFKQLWPCTPCPVYLHVHFKSANTFIFISVSISITNFIKFVSSPKMVSITRPHWFWESA